MGTTFEMDHFAASVCVYQLCIMLCVAAVGLEVLPKLERGKLAHYPLM